MSSGEENPPSSSSQRWSRLARTVYDPIKVGSIDGMDEFAHDRALIRAMNSSYKPNHKVVGDPHHTVFIGRIAHYVTENRIRELFERCGKIVHCRLVTDVVTGLSRGYAFVEYKRRRYAKRAIEEMHGKVLDGKEILVDEEWERRLDGWKPRRLGGGFGGRKKSQQLRFGCKDRPWKKPVGDFKYTSKSDFHRKTKQQRALLNSIEPS
ncbi:U11/U12 small nuclear ribonucleoprotein 35 kDa protein-like [Toxorhynchites rutilus septentrionalis]|uniref:U11/U12 small nuclear ribonucleoprotein 35 kDa protein-like n=1 Tax=Toxorhynchites rutilus septentrionalis TaxID=329112 RepID=UPI00247B1ED6|nr:U11/U12 small nuclear ribonucleoprotein 35 kDa protein-like [Toxorhynchites rutilus septentrionalis]